MLGCLSISTLPSTKMPHLYRIERVDYTTFSDQSGIQVGRLNFQSGLLIKPSTNSADDYIKKVQVLLLEHFSGKPR